MSQKLKKAVEQVAPDDRAKVLELCINNIERAHGKGSIMRLGDHGSRISVESIPTGILSLDIATGIGGIPRGRVIEIFGPESSGKTTVALHVIAETQKNGGMAAFIDVEHSLDPLYAQKLGVDIENLLVAQPDFGEQALEITDVLVKSSVLDIICIDSVAALVPQAEIDGEMGASHVGLQARLMSQALRKLTGSVSKTRTSVIFINQLRDVIGNPYNPNAETTAGGRALKFYSSMRLDVRRKEQVKQGTEVIGYKTKIRVVKNKVAPPFKEAEVELYFNEGFPREICLINLGVKHNIVEKSGTWYSYGETRIGQGYENARSFLKENREIAYEIEGRVKAAFSAGRPALSLLP